jgi:hypothetical protein
VSSMSVRGGNTDGRSRSEVLNSYENEYLTSELSSNELGWTGDVTGCVPGTLAPVVYERTLQRIIYFRHLVGLPTSVIYESGRNAKCQQASLMCLANRTLDHSPPATWACYTADGAEACGRANLSSASAAGAIRGQIADNGSGNFAAGHRRWILYSKGRTFGIGSGSSYCALWVLGNSSNPIPDNMPDFIAYPSAGYVPAPLVFNRWSFGIPGADFRNAQVSMSGPEGAVSLTKETVSHNSYGDNTVVWVPSGISSTSTSDVSYTVTVNDVRSASRVSYTYTVTIAKPGAAVNTRVMARWNSAKPAVRRVVHANGVAIVDASNARVAYDTGGRVVEQHAPAGPGEPISLRIRQ